MESINYQGYARENKVQIPDAPDLLKRIQLRNQEYIESLKYVRDFSAQQDAAAIRDLEATRNLEYRQSKQVRDDELKQKQRFADRMEARYRAQARDAAAKAGTEKDPIDYLKGIAELSKTAASTLQDYAKQKAETDLKEAQIVASYRPYDPEVLGISQQAQDMKISGSYLDLEAAKLRLQGDDDAADQLMSLNQAQKFYYNQAKAKEAAIGFPQQALLWAQNNPEATMIIDGEEVEVKSINFGDSSQRDQLMRNFVPIWAEQSGFRDTNPKAIADAYSSINTQIRNDVAEVRKTEIDTNLANKVDTATQIVFTDPTPGNVKDLWMAVYNTNNGNDAEARTALNNIAKDVNTPQEVVDAIATTKLGANQKPYAEQYPDEWSEVTQTRDKAFADQINQDQKNREAQGVLWWNNIMLPQIRADFDEDGDIDTTSEQWQQAQALVRMNGWTQVARKMADFAPLTETAKQEELDNAIQEKVDRLTSIGIAYDENDVYTSGASPKKQLELLDKLEENQAKAQTGSQAKEASKRNKEALESTFEKELKFDQFNNVGITSKYSYERASDYLDKEWNRIYSSTYRSSAATTEEAKQAAAEAAADAHTLKLISDGKKGQGMLVLETDSGGQPTGRFKNFTQEAMSAKAQNAPKPTLGPLAIQIRAEAQTSKAGVINKLFVPKTELESIGNSMKINGRMLSIPASLVLITAAARQFDPSITNAEVMAAQIKAYEKETGKPLEGGEEILNAIGESTKTIQSLPPRYATMLKNFPTPQTANIVATQLGQNEPYPRTDKNAETERAMNLVYKYESANDTQYDGYDSMNQGGIMQPNGYATPVNSTTGSQQFGKPLINMTMDEIVALQADGKLFAAGRYQFIPSTLLALIKQYKIPGTTLFSADVQDLLFINAYNVYGWEPWEQSLSRKASQQELSFLDSVKGKLVNTNVSPWRQPVNLRPGL